MKRTGYTLIPFLFLFILNTSAFAVEVAPRISDREIIEGLADIRGDIKKLEEGQNALNKRIDNLENSLNKRIDSLEISLNKRIDDLQWMFGIYITISIIILGFVLRMQWQMHKRQTRTETTLETQKDELAFIKGLIEKLLPPRGVL
ncbi:MAG: hypothetical protein HZB81_03900 [Deltaproteobacteria bacterium]|nr:hypothetical protein [Deltaproteobacteria bacterium]